MDKQSDERQQQLLVQFMEVVNEPIERSRQFLEATNWQLEEAIQLFFAGAGPAVAEETPIQSVQPEPVQNIEADSTNIGEDYVRPPLPVKREALYEDVLQYRAQRRTQQASDRPTTIDAFRNFEDEFNARFAKTNDASAGSSEDVRATTLASLYRPPLELNFRGTFEQAKAEAAKQEKWLLVNLQSHTEFASHMLNRDTWAHEAVKETVGTTFIFWQMYDETEEGKKVCTYYKLSTMPTILVLDPITGQKMRSWEGMVGAERLLEDLVPFMDSGPMERQPYANHTQKRPRDADHALNVKVGDVEEDEELQQALAASLQGVGNEPLVGAGVPDENLDDSFKAQIEYPVLPEEPKPDEAGACRVGIRFPDGNRGQRRFLRSDPLTYLWSYCSSKVKEAASGRTFRLTIPGVSGPLEYNPSVNIAEAGVANSMLVMAWD